MTMLDFRCRPLPREPATPRYATPLLAIDDFLYYFQMGTKAPGLARAESYTTGLRELGID